MTNIQLGEEGEKQACKFLESQNYNIITRNYKCTYGEIDIIAKDNKEIVFIEVKTRCSKKYGEASEAVNFYKKKHMKKAALYYCCRHKLENEFIRFDIIEVYVKDGKFFIRHIKNTLW